MKQEKYFTQQWVEADVAKQLQKTAVKHPEFNVHIQEMEWHEDGDMVKLRFTFRNVGKIAYMQRVFAFLIKSLNGDRN